MSTWPLPTSISETSERSVSSVLLSLRRHLSSTHLIASPVVHALAPSARSLAVPSNKSYNSSADSRVQEPIVMDFSSGWRAGPVHEWYKSQPTTRFLHLEYRKELTGAFRHEFIVVQLDNGTCCRFDRRAKQELRVHAVKDEGTIAEDTAHVLHLSQAGFAAIGNESELVLGVDFPEGQDLLLILAIFFSLKSNSESRRYTLTRFNCYFVCWTVALITARCVTDWDTISDQWDGVTQSTLDALDLYHRAHRPKLWSSDALSRRRRGVFGPQRLTYHPFTSRVEAKDNSPFGKTLSLEVSKIKGVVAPTIQDFLLRSRAKSTMCALIRAAIANAITEVAGKHALYVRSHMRINRRRSLGVAKLFTTRVYEPGASKLAANALKKAATRAQQTFRVDPNNSVRKDWRKEWDEQWRMGWLKEEKLPIERVRDDWQLRFPPPLQVQLDQDSWEFLQNQHRAGWIKEFKLIRQLGEPYLLTLTQAATSCLSELVPDLDPARLTTGRVPTLGYKLPKDSDDTLGTRGTNEPAFPSFQDIIHRRIETHCLMVQNSGFGFSAEVRNDIEDVMTEIWISTRDALRV
ncbi:hypothetical protein FRC08_008609 [Ceratobasidium sp. 394]|nr:hypothetical protein FRC08_008609 [Ceratobasidium sp. 394]